MVHTIDDRIALRIATIARWQPHARQPHATAASLETLASQARQALKVVQRCGNDVAKRWGLSWTGSACYGGTRAATSSAAKSCIEGGGCSVNWRAGRRTNSATGGAQREHLTAELLKGWGRPHTDVEAVYRIHERTQLACGLSPVPVQVETKLRDATLEVDDSTIRISFARQRTPSARPRRRACAPHWRR